MNATEQRARELLAAEFQKDGYVAIAATIRSGRGAYRQAIRAIMAALSEPAGSGEAVAWRSMSTAPKDGTMIRLLVDFTDHATEDSPEPSPTIGACTDDNTGENEGWKFAGWCWSHDHFIEGKGTPVGWLPMLDAHPAPVVVDEAWPVGVLARDKTLATLRYFADWRRGGDGDQPDARMVGLALDAALAALTQPSQPGEEG
ncbi:hypothetical protein [Marilutibacter spongiae]|uniref:Uncharacterized protein n=1 Tax=Marilutibacter spongiae TaxID=2025720 RepID=A0A7W3Y5V3_9GAMM|nr:hypothetical protein [Lysobacter spongiae]MBB1060375.1 hypothetical protein [Lysobacter spongiae]